MAPPPGLRRIAYAREHALLLTFDGLTLFAFVGAAVNPKWQLHLEKPIASVVIGPTKGEATVVDEDGAAHAVDLALGTLVRSAAAVGPPLAVAAGGALAIAVAGKVLLSRKSEGKPDEVECSAVALAFSRDGETLAMATDKGSLFLVDMTTRTIAARHTLGLPICDLAPGPNGEWLAATGDGLYVVEDGAARKVIDRAVLHVAIDADGKRVALHRTPSRVAIYAYPPEAPLLRMLLDEPRLIEDVAFDAGGSLAIALDGDDACIVDLKTLQIKHPVVPHEGADNREWKLRVQREKKDASAGGVKAVATSSATWKWGLGLALLAVIVAVRIFNRAGHTPPGPDPAPAQSHVKKPRDKPEKSVHTFGVMRLRGASLTADAAVHPATSGALLYASPDGTTFLVTADAGTCTMQVKPPVGAWRTDITKDCAAMQLFGRGEREVYVTFDRSIFAFDGAKEWATIGFGEDAIVDLAGSSTTDDLYTLTEEGVLQHRHAGEWTKDESAGNELDSIYSGPTVWAHGATAAIQDALLQKSGAGWNGHPSPSDFQDLWISPTGHLFVAKGPTVARSTDDGATWNELKVGGSVSQLWGRSSTDVYAAGADGLFHFDGTAWSKTSFDKPIEALAGDAHDVVVVVRTQ